MKLKYSILFLLFIASNLIIGQEAEEPNSQDHRLIVGVAKFSSSNVKQERFAGMLAERVLDILNQQNRFKVVDLDGAARKQAISKAQENYKSDNWIEDNKTISAEYTLTGVIGSIKFLRLNAGKGYKATITYTIKILNTETGEIIHNGTSSFTSHDSDIKLTPESALQSAITSTEDAVKQYFSTSFPIKLDLLRLEKTKKKKALAVLLGGGSKIGVIEGQKFEVYYIDNTFGKPLPKIIGKIKVSRILSEDFSEAKVIDGHEEIKLNFEEGNKLICKNIK